MKTLFYALCFCCLFMLSATQALANGITVTAVQRLAAPNRDKVQFTLSWQNSWWVTGIPGNYDAAWCFIKFRACGTSTDWEHALLSTTMTDHTLGSDLAFAKNITTTDRNGAAGSHNTGAMVRRAVHGTGNIAANVCTLRVVGSSSGAVFDPAVEYDVRVIGIEMVQIPQDIYPLGDANSLTYDLQQNSSSSGAFNVTTETATLSVYDPACGVSRTLPIVYPKGYAEFFIMKYEISMGQYADFLNTLSGASANTRFPNVNGNTRHSLYVGTVAGVPEYVSDRKDRACNFLSYDDVLSYLDWAALRPMTELEFEKACKGTGVFAPSAFAWGTTSWVRALVISAGSELGSETCTTVNANINSQWNPCCTNPSGGDNNFPGPMGCGIFARDNTLTRDQTGATYYGVMEMSGNVWEMVITTYQTNNCSTNPTYSGVWGDGMLNAATGIWNTTLWPAGSTNSPGPNGMKGGSFQDDPGGNSHRVADRNYCYYGPGSSYNRNSNIGGRGVR